MPISQSAHDEIQTWTIHDKRDADSLYFASHPPPPGAALNPMFLSLFEVRVLDIMIEKLPAQLEATPLLRPEYQDMADRLAAYRQEPVIAQWTSLTPPAVKEFTLGDLEDNFSEDGLGDEAPSLPQVIVSSSAPASNDAFYPATGPLMSNEVSVYLYYVLPYERGWTCQQKALRGAEAMAAVMLQYYGDPLTCWQKGEVQFSQRNVPLVGANNVRKFAAGIVQFSANRYLPFKPL